jgi:hypothetical protein
MVGLRNPNEYNCIDFFVIVAYFLGQKQKMDVCGIIIKCRYIIFCRIDLLALFIPSLLSEAQAKGVGGQHSNIPSFHAAYQDNVRKKHRDSLRGVGPSRRGLYEPEANKLY